MPEKAIPPTQAERDRQGSVLRALRDAKGWGQTKAGAKIGISASQVSRYESGENMLPTNYIGLVAKAYGIEKGDLTTRLGLMDDDLQVVESYDPKAELDASGVVPAEHIQKLVIDLQGRPEANQRAMVASAIQHFRVLEQKAGAG